MKSYYQNTKSVFAAYISGVYSSVHQTSDEANAAAAALEPVNGLAGRVDVWEPGSLGVEEGEVSVMAHGALCEPLRSTPLFHVDQVRWAFKPY